MSSEAGRGFKNDHWDNYDELEAKTSTVGKIRDQ